MAQLPLIVSKLSDLAPKWKSILDPVIAAPMSNVSILSNISLAVGNTVINHKLGRQMQGWFITDINGSAVIYRSAALNDLTITLHSSAAVTVSLGVF